MDTKSFRDLIKLINHWDDENFPSLTINQKLFLLTRSQWKTFEKAVLEKEITGFNLCQGETVDFSDSTWCALFLLLQKTQVEQLILSKEPLDQYDNVKWNAIFSKLRTTVIKKLGFQFANFSEISLVNLPHFFRELSLSSTIEELDLSGNNFSEASKPFCNLLFDGLAHCVNIKHLLLDYDFCLGGSSESFWDICAKKISTTSIKHLSFNNTGLHDISELNWLNFCEGLKQSKVDYLSLRDNCFYNFDVEQWKWFFHGIAVTSITELDLNEHHSLELNGDKWEVFCHGLKATTIKTLNYESSQFTGEQQKIIEQILRENQKKMAFVVEEQKTEMDLQLQLKVKTVLTTYNSTIETQQKHLTSKEKKNNYDIRLKNQKFQLDKNKENEKPLLKNYAFRKRTVQEENTKNIAKKARSHMKPKTVIMSHEIC